jgi:hypothetical protein
MYRSDVRSVTRVTNTRTHCLVTWGLSAARNPSSSARSALILPNIEAICKHTWLASIRLASSSNDVITDIRSTSYYVVLLKGVILIWNCQGGPANKWVSANDEYLGSFPFSCEGVHRRPTWHATFWSCMWVLNGECVITDGITSINYYNHYGKCVRSLLHASG